MPLPNTNPPMPPPPPPRPQQNINKPALNIARPKQVAKPQDKSIFGGKEEISRVSLRYKLLKDPEVWKAQKDLRMNLSPVERSKLEKETFAPVYGRNISKKDLGVNLKKMGREWATTADPKRKEFLRKEIKFFKKIGGIK